MKGIILAGGTASRLYPATLAVSKQMLPIYDKPMIYYPLSTLMLADIRDILVISTPDDLQGFKKLLGDGSQFGMNFQYAEQDKPRGLADAFRVGKDFIAGEKCSLILGDNIFHGSGLSGMLKEASTREKGATIFGKHVSDPQRYGVVEFDKFGKVLSLEEKPQDPKSKWAVVGLYFYDENVVKMAESLKPSNRGELEITDLNREYLKQGNLEVKLMPRGFSWLDTGTNESLKDAGDFVASFQKSSGSQIACLEEIAWNKGWINDLELKKSGELFEKTSYGKYILSLLK